MNQLFARFSGPSHSGTAPCAAPVVPAELLHGASCLWPAPPPGSVLGAPRAVVDSTRLTPAEQAVLQLLQAGCSNKEIAGLLRKAEPTVKHQVSAILRKTGQPSRARLIALLR